MPRRGWWRASRAASDGGARPRRSPRWSVSVSRVASAEHGRPPSWRLQRTGSGGLSGRTSDNRYYVNFCARTKNGPVPAESGPGLWEETETRTLSDARRHPSGHRCVRRHRTAARRRHRLNPGWALAHCIAVREHCCCAEPLAASRRNGLAARCKPGRDCRRWAHRIAAIRCRRTRLAAAWYSARPGSGCLESRSSRWNRAPFWPSCQPHRTPVRRIASSRLRRPRLRSDEPPAQPIALGYTTACH